MQSATLRKRDVCGCRPGGDGSVGGDDGLAAHHLQGSCDDRGAARNSAIERNDCEGIRGGRNGWNRNNRGACGSLWVQAQYERYDNQGEECRGTNCTTGPERDCTGLRWFHATFPGNS